MPTIASLLLTFALGSTNLLATAAPAGAKMPPLFALGSANIPLVFALGSAKIPFVFALGSANSDCAASYQAHLRTDMDLSLDAFDQTEGQGFRALARAGCYREAGDLIEAWMKRRDAVPSNVHWHLAQMRAHHDDRPAAIAAARRSLQPAEAPDAAFKWNDYALATIAFLERDRTAFDRHRNALATAASQHAGNALNLKLIDLLGRHFDLNYLQAQRADRESGP
ncbi:hypothetical protein [Tahibacter sp.]|uniref:hypothetical protein n=1 Tax=Tahibacter sp. TaxID=2056211 RepID=UPI0028C43315|nr:hypothetical protein [Tahibacter sp.]